MRCLLWLNWHFFDGRHHEPSVGVPKQLELVHGGHSETCHSFGLLSCKRLSYWSYCWCLRSRFGNASFNTGYANACHCVNGCQWYDWYCKGGGQLIVNEMGLSQRIHPSTAGLLVHPRRIEQWKNPLGFQTSRPNMTKPSPTTSFHRWGFNMILCFPKSWVKTSVRF